VEHRAASAPGARIRCQSVLTLQDGLRYVFELKAWEGDELIGTGIHERFAVKIDRFLGKLEAKNKG